MPVEMAVKMLPKMMNPKPFSIPNLTGGDITIKLPNIKNPTIMNEFPTNVFLDAPSSGQAAQLGNFIRQSDDHWPFLPNNLTLIP